MLVSLIAEPLERREQLLLGAAWNAGSLVDDVDQHAIADAARVHPDHAVRGVAQRVVDQVDQHPFQQTGVGQRHRVTDVDLDLRSRARCTDPVVPPLIPSSARCTTSSR